MSLGGASEPVSPPPLARSLALSAAAAVRADLVGVDLLPTQNGYVISELKNTPKTTAPNPLRFSRSGASTLNGSGFGDLGPRQSTLGHELSNAIHELGIPIIAPGHALAEVCGESGVGGPQHRESDRAG